MNSRDRRIAKLVPTAVAMIATMLVTYPMFANSVELLVTILAAFVTYFGMHYLATRLVYRVLERHCRPPQ